VLPDRYDDGGYSGGSIDRPAMTKLLEDVQHGKIDCVVVYKVDRLSRSLLDFARVMKLFEDSGVHFVSVTQHFNTAESMGRLTLNILLSFAQFEREIIGERIRDKIAASRRKGKWPGGNLILGYDLDRPNRRLVVNEQEAEQVREVFNLYLHHESLLPVVEELGRRGWTNKSWIDRNGKPCGGRPFDKNNLYLMLTNVAYLGKVRHKQEVYEGEHEAIVDPALYGRVQRMLERNRRTRGSLVRNRYGALLKGILRCTACQKAMIHCPVAKGTRLWRYYVCIKAQKKGTSACPAGWVNAQRLEQAVVEQLSHADPDVLPVEATPLIDGSFAALPATEQALLIRKVVQAVEYDARSKRLRIRLREQEDDPCDVAACA
jgi:site-specific DNA recombinase